MTVASLLPGHHRGAIALERATAVAIAMLFFFHGAKLSRKAVLSGIAHVRLHALVVVATFGLFPLLGLALGLLTSRVVMLELTAGVDEIAIVFCGSKKSLASGVPLAGVLFPGAAGGAMVLPSMIFHQLQLMVCAILAQRYARRTDG